MHCAVLETVCTQLLVCVVNRGCESNCRIAAHTQSHASTTAMSYSSKTNDGSSTTMRTMSMHAGIVQVVQALTNALDLIHTWFPLAMFTLAEKLPSIVDSVAWATLTMQLFTVVVKLLQF